MKSLDIIQSYLRWSGFFRGRTKRERLFGISIRCGFLAFLLSYFIFPLWYLMYTAKTFSECSEGVFFVLSGSLLISWYLSLWYRSRQIIALIRELDAIIDQSN